LFGFSFRLEQHDRAPLPCLCILERGRREEYKYLLVKASINSTMNTALLPFKHPYTMVVCGPTQSSKTGFVLKLIDNSSTVMGSFTGFTEHQLLSTEGARCRTCAAVFTVYAVRNAAVRKDLICASSKIKILDVYVYVAARILIGAGS
jgi:hypothetical protein